MAGATSGAGASNRINTHTTKPTLSNHSSIRTACINRGDGVKLVTGRFRANFMESARVEALESIITCKLGRIQKKTEQPARVFGF